MDIKFTTLPQNEVGKDWRAVTKLSYTTHRIRGRTHKRAVLTTRGLNLPEGDHEMWMVIRLVEAVLILHSTKALLAFGKKQLLR
jgi:hypothetical protein